MNPSAKQNKSYLKTEIKNIYEHKFSRHEKIVRQYQLEKLTVVWL